MKNHFSFSINIREMKCILISLLILLVSGFASISALRCITTDGLQVDKVRRVMKKCMKKVTTSGKDDDDDEYENFESVDYEMKDRGGSVGGRDSNNNDRMNRNNNYNPRLNQYDERSAQTGGNYYQEMNRPRNDRLDPWMQQQQQFNPYQQQSPPSYNNNYFAGNQRGDFNGYQNKNANDNSTSSQHEKDRACIFQCFFMELKMVIFWSPPSPLIFLIFQIDKRGRLSRSQ